MKIKTPLLWRILNTLRNKLTDINYSQKLFKQLSPKPIFYIQIGANDGKSTDPIYEHSVGWNGILVEPLPHIFEKLKANYADRKGKLIFENVAISDSKGSLTLFMPKVDKETPWVSKVASAKKESEMLVGSDVTEVEVPCLSLDMLLQKHNVKNIDLLVVDVEGFEWKILENYSFTVKPKVIYMEIRFYNYHQLITIYKKFYELGYRIFPEKDNCLMILK